MMACASPKSRTSSHEQTQKQSRISSPWPLPPVRGWILFAYHDGKCEPTEQNQFSLADTNTEPDTNHWDIFTLASTSCTRVGILFAYHDGKCETTEQNQFSLADTNTEPDTNHWDIIILASTSCKRVDSLAYHGWRERDHRAELVLIS